MSHSTPLLPPCRSPIKISLEWAEKQEWHIEDMYIMLNTIFPELKIPRGTKIREIVSRIIELYQPYIQETPSGTHVLTIDKPTERQTLQCLSLRSILRAEEQEFAKAATRWGRFAAIKVPDVNQYWMSVDGKIKLYFPRTKLMEVVPSTESYPSINVNSAVENPYIATPRLRTTVGSVQDGTFLVVDDTPPVSTTEDGGEEYSQETTGEEVRSGQNPEGNVSSAQYSEEKINLDQGAGALGGSEEDGERDEQPEESENRKRVSSVQDGNGEDSGQDGGEPPLGDLGDRDPGAFADDEASEMGVSGSADELSSEGDSVYFTSDEGCLGEDDAEENPSVVHRGPTSPGTLADNISRSNSALNISDHSANSGDAAITHGTAPREHRKSDSESAPDDEPFAGPIPANLIVPLHRHIAERYDSSDDETEKLLIEDIYGDGIIPGNTTADLWAWLWDMCPKVLIALLKFEYVIRTEVLLDGEGPWDDPSNEIRRYAREATDESLRLVIWLSKGILQISNLMPDDHADVIYQRRKLQMAKLVRQIIRGVGKAREVVLVLREAMLSGGRRARQKAATKMRRFHRRCTWRREWLRDIGVEFDWEPFEALEYPNGVGTAPEPPEATREYIGGVVRGINDGWGGEQGTVLPAKWASRERRCSEGCYPLTMERERHPPKE